MDVDSPSAAGQVLITDVLQWSHVLMDVDSCDTLGTVET